MIMIISFWRPNLLVWSHLTVVSCLTRNNLNRTTRRFFIDLNCTTLDLRTFEERRKKAEAALVTIERDSLLKWVRSFEEDKSISLQTIASLSSELEKLRIEVEPLQPEPDLTVYTRDFGGGLFQSYLSQGLVQDNADIDEAFEKLEDASYLEFMRNVVPYVVFLLYSIILFKNL